MPRNLQNTNKDNDGNQHVFIKSTALALVHKYYITPFHHSNIFSLFAYFLCLDTKNSSNYCFILTFYWLLTNYFLLICLRYKRIYKYKKTLRNINDSKNNFNSDIKLNA